MKTTILILLCMILSGITFGQIEEAKMKHVDLGEVKVVPPKFTGIVNPVPVLNEGKFESIDDYLARNIQYPEEDVKCLNQGTEVVKFTVSPTGELTDFTIINGVSPQINDEVIRILQTTKGMWMPGYNNNEPVAMEKEVSVAFKITGMRYPIDFKVQGTKYFSQGGELFLTKHNPKKALKYYDKGIMLLPNDESLLLMRGLARYETGDKAGASDDWKRIASLGIAFSNEYLSSFSDLKGYEELTHVLTR